MAKILPFNKDSARKTTGRNKKPKGFSGGALCANNHHKWKINKGQRFDTLQGKLVTVECCERCGKTRNRLT